MCVCVCVCVCHRVCASTDMLIQVREILRTRFVLVIEIEIDHRVEYIEGH